MAEKMPIRIRERETYSAGTYSYVKSKIVPPGELWCLQGCQYENESSAAGTFRRYIEGHGYDHFLAEHQSPGAAELIFSEKDIWLLPGERLVVRQASPVASDVLALYSQGFKVHSKFIPGGE